MYRGRARPHVHHGAMGVPVRRRSDWFMEVGIELRRTVATVQVYRQDLEDRTALCLERRKQVGAREDVIEVVVQHVEVVEDRRRFGKLFREVAFLNEVPGVRTGVATVDLMRHRREAPNGVTDYLFCELMLRLHEEGYRWFSLGLAPLAGVGDRPGASLQERAVHQVYEHLTTVFSFKGLRNYKAKFEPSWEERFLVYQDGLPV